MRAAFVLAVQIASALSLDNGLARTPPMGWSTWNQFACDYTEVDLREIADVMVANGFLDLGYQYLNIDDCWQGGRDADGNIVHNATRFPNGIKAWCDYLHSVGLRCGLYTSSGPTSCAGKVGSWEHEYQDSNTFASWGVNYLKVDCCGTNLTMKNVSYDRFNRALNATGRPILYSCDTDELFPAYPPEPGNIDDYWLWAPTTCNIWRTWHDIKPHLWSWTLNLEFQQRSWRLVDTAPFAAPGSFNDPDILEVGVTRSCPTCEPSTMTEAQQRSHFSLWCMLAAPLIMGNDLRNMTNATVTILTNAELIAVDQDALGRQAVRIRSDLEADVYARPLLDGIAVAFHNMRGVGVTTVGVDWSELGLSPARSVRVRDLWRHAELGNFTGSFVAKGIAFEDIVVVKLFT